MKKRIIICSIIFVIVLAVTAIAVGAYFTFWNNDESPQTNNIRIVEIDPPQNPAGQQVNLAEYRAKLQHVIDRLTESGIIVEDQHPGRLNKGLSVNGEMVTITSTVGINGYIDGIGIGFYAFHDNELLLIEEHLSYQDNLDRWEWRNYEAVVSGILISPSRANDANVNRAIMGKIISALQ